jgi:hypothetical protein
MASASKRDRSPSPTLSPRKRPRQIDARHARSQPSHESGGRTATIGGGINDIVSSHEIFLNVLSFLDAEELTKVEGVSRYWRSMALDSHVSRAGKTVSGGADYSIVAIRFVTTALEAAIPIQVPWVIFQDFGCRSVGCDLSRHR